MASILGGILGAGAGMATGGPVQAGLSGLAGLLGGGGGQQSAAQRAALDQQRQIANQLYNYGTSNPMTNQQDLNSLAQSMGQLGQQERSNLGSLASFGNPMINTGGMGSLMAGVQANDMAGRESLTSQHMQDAIASRRQALLQAAGANQSAYQMASGQGSTPPNTLGQSLAGLAQQYAYQQAQKSGAPEATNVTGGGQQKLPPGAAWASDPTGQGLIPAGADLPQNEGVSGGAGDAPAAKHDPLQHAMVILHELIKAHLPAPKGKGKRTKKRKKKAVGAGDMPPMGMMPGAPNQTQGAGAPGNEPGGANGVANQARRPQEAMLDRLRFPSGQVYTY
jgi:hypothetical protein